MSEREDGDGPTSSDLTRLVQAALRRSLPWHERLRLWLSRLKSRAATMGGYWGGVTMRWRRDK